MAPQQEAGKHQTDESGIAMDRNRADRKAVAEMS